MNWKEIWEGRVAKLGLLGHSNYSLAQLISLDGFDIGAGEISEEAWLQGASKVRKHLAPRPGDSLLEIGCGSGAFMKALGDDLKFTGIDLSSELIEVARQAVPQGEFHVWDLNQSDGKLSLLEPLRTFDFCLIHGVLHYLDTEVARQTVKEALARTSRKVFIGEIPDLSKIKRAEEIREKSMPRGEYKKKYSLLGHTYFPEHFFRDILSEIDSANHWELRIYPKSLLDTSQKNFRFSALYTRRHEQSV